MELDLIVVAPDAGAGGGHRAPQDGHPWLRPRYHPPRHQADPCGHVQEN